MKLSTLVGTALIGLACNTSLYAGEQGHHSDNHHEQHHEELVETLNLTPEQSTAVRNIMDEKHQSMRELRESIRPQMDAIHSDAKAQLNEVLNEEQMAKLEKMHAQKRSHWKSKKLPKDKHPE